MRMRQQKDGSGASIDDLLIPKSDALFKSLGNSNREHTFAFQYLRNGHIYIELNYSYLNEVICCYREAPGAPMKPISSECITPVLTEDSIE